MAQKKRKPKQAEKKEPTENQFYSRILHRAYLRDGDITHTGEALALALLLHANGKKRDRKNVEEVGRLLNDPNLSKR